MRNTQPNSAKEHLKATNFYYIVPKDEKEDLVPEVKKAAPDWVPRAVYPMITQECFAATMHNFRVWKEAYNKKVDEYNENVDWHNAGVDFHAEYEGHTPTEIAWQNLYHERYKKLKKAGELNIQDYNNEIEKVCEQHGYHFLKKLRMHTIKYQAELVFQNLLHVYNCQLEKRNKEYMRLGIQQADPLREFEINARFITKLMREGVISIDICSDTVRNHRKRLQEAGVLLEYTFRGRQKGVHVYFNPQILVVLDAFTMQQAVAENQAPTEVSNKVLPDINEITRPKSIDKVYKTDDASHSSIDKECLPGTPPVYKSFVQDHQVQGQKISPGGRAENVKVELSASQKLLKTVLPANKLDEAIRMGEFDNYTPIDIRILRNEMAYGTLTKEEYQKVVVQDILKTAAKMWRGRQDIFAGCWANTYKQMLEEHFRMKQVWSKDKIFSDIEQYRYRLSRAHLWFLSNELQPMYPSKYFDIRRRDKKDFAFEYTIKFWNNHLEYEKDRPNRIAKKEAMAKARAKEATQNRRFKYWVNKFVGGKCNIDQLVQYVKNNLPKQFDAQLGVFIQKHIASENHRSKYIA